jgi:hypothetical protein
VNWLHGIKIIPDEDVPEGMVAIRDENGNLNPLGFVTEFVERPLSKPDPED